MEEVQKRVELVEEAGRPLDNILHEISDSEDGLTAENILTWCYEQYEADTDELGQLKNILGEIVSSSRASSFHYNQRLSHLTPEHFIVKVFDEGVELDGDIGSIDFVGAGVVATNDGEDITVTITGAAANATYDEVLTGTGTAFALANAPSPTGSLILVKNGQLLTLDEDYTLSGVNITLLVAKVSDDVLIAKQYTYA